MPFPCLLFTQTRCLRSYLYGGTYNQFKVLLKKFGIGVKFVQGETSDFAAAIDDKTKAIYVESIGNPKYNVSNIAALAKVCIYALLNAQGRF